MKLGILADTHDNLGAINRAVNILNEEGVELAVHAGDFIAPFTARAFKSLNCGLVGIFGNNDGEKLGLRKAFEGIGELHEDPHAIERGGRSIILTHRPAIADALASKYDIVVYGHTHEVHMATLAEGNKIIINPGECGGWLSGKSTLVILDLEDLKPRVVEF